MSRRGRHQDEQLRAAGHGSFDDRDGEWNQRQASSRTARHSLGHQSFDDRDGEWNQSQASGRTARHPPNEPTFEEWVDGMTFSKYADVLAAEARNERGGNDRARAHVEDYVERELGPSYGVRQGLAGREGRSGHHGHGIGDRPPPHRDPRAHRPQHREQDDSFGDSTDFDIPSRGNRRQHYEPEDSFDDGTDYDIPPRAQPRRHSGRQPTGHQHSSHHRSSQHVTRHLR